MSTSKSILPKFLVNPFIHSSLLNLDNNNKDRANKQLFKMEFFSKAKAVRLRSHLDKYLVADDDEETVRQSRNGSSRRARWTVEFVEGKSHVVRLKSCHDWYLTASDEPFLLGMTGKKVVQSAPASKRDNSVEWEPIKEGDHVKLRSKEGGKFLRANGGTPPWRNSVTHDFPHRTATQDWVLWEVEMVDIFVPGSDSFQRFDSTASNFSPARGDLTGSYTNSPSITRTESPHAYGRKVHNLNWITSHP